MTADDQGPADGNPADGRGRAAADAMPADLTRALDELRGRRPELAFDVRWHASLPSTMDAVAAAGEAGARGGIHGGRRRADRGARPARTLAGSLLQEPDSISRISIVHTVLWTW